MSAHSMQQPQDKSEPSEVAILAIPTLLAVVAVSVVVGLNVGPRSTRADNAASAAPTPYSADHARIAPDSGTQEPAPTF
jgi:hypothetical protein